MMLTYCCVADRECQGTTIEYGSDKANGTLASMAWNGKRGKSLPPVWLTVHKV